MQLLSVFVLYAWVFCSSAFVLDDLTRRVATNRLGYRRECRITDRVPRTGVRISEKGSVYEYLAPKTGKYNLTKKSVVLVYSAEVAGVHKLCLRLRDKKTGGSHHILILNLSLGSHQRRLVPLELFGHVDLSKATALVIKGPMVLHEIQLIDDFDLNRDAVAPDLSFDVAVSPILLVDDFQQWSGPFKNPYNIARFISSTAKSGPGYISDIHDIVLMHFTNPSNAFNLQYLSIRLIYSSQSSTECHVKLILSDGNGQETNSPSYKIGINKGHLMEFNIDGYAIQHSSTQLPTLKAFGIIVQGSNTVQGPITLHRIELIANKYEPKRIDLPSEYALLHPMAQSFVKKTRWFRNALQLIKVHEPFDMGVCRENIINDAFYAMDTKSFRMDLDVYFYYVRRAEKSVCKSQFFNYLWSELTMPDRRLLVKVSHSPSVYAIVPQANVDSVKLDLYRFVGQIIGMAILNKEMRDVAFVPMVSRALLDKPLRFADLEHINSDFMYKMQAHVPCDDDVLKPSTISDADMDLSTNDVTNFDLIENRLNYVHAKSLWQVNHLVGPQALALRTGLYEVIPKEFLQVFDEYELAHLISGCKSGHNYLPSMYYC